MVVAAACALFELLCVEVGHSLDKGGFAGLGISGAVLVPGPSEKAALLENQAFPQGTQLQGHCWTTGTINPVFPQAVSSDPYSPVACRWLCR